MRKKTAAGRSCGGFFQEKRKQERQENKVNIFLAAVNAKYIHSNLAVYSMRAYAKAQGIRTDLEEFTINQQKDEILKKLYEKQPQVLCFSCYIWNISFVKDLIRDLKQVLPQTEIWAGGPEVSYDAEKFLDEMPQVSGVMCGEGEETFLELAEYYINRQKEKKELSEIRGIVYRQEKKIYRNPLREILDMDRLVFPYEDMSLFRNKIIYYESSRGCPFSCSYCLSSIDKKLRFRSLNLVKKELQFFLDQKVSQVKFVDRTFNCRKEHAAEIWQYLKEHDNGITNFHFEIAADLLTEEEIALLNTMRPGAVQLEIGVQSTNPATIREIRRKTSFDRIREQTEKIKAGKNIHQHMDLIAGLPFEGYDSFRKSFCDVYALKPQQLQLGFLKVLKGSYMHEMAEEYGCLYKASEPYEVLETRWLDYGEICRLKGVEDMVEVYYNSGQFSRTMEAVEELFEDAFSMYEALARFYERKGYEGLSHSRIRRYEILREFLEERQEADREYYDQLMVYDLYARENLKTRPVWAPDTGKYKQKIREFYAGEAQEPRFLKNYRGYQAKQLEKMTHLEIFDWKVREGDRKRACCALLFDYSRRNPLTKDAEVYEVEL